MQEGSIFIAPKTYTFTLKTMDLSGNKSSGITKNITPTAIQGKAMQITLTPSTTEITNQNADVNISITTDATSITTVKYESGNQNISYFTSNGTEILADSNGAYSFTASKNGTYTVYVFDSDGRRETQTVKIENIDKTLPIKVVNLMAVYGSNFDLISSQTDSTLKVQITSSDGAIVHATQEATVNTTNNTATATITAPSLSSSQATVNGTDYTIRAKVCGTIDNKPEHTATLNISSAATIDSISLSTTKLSVDDVTSEQTTTATVTGKNLDVAGTITLQLYDSTEKAYGSAIPVNKSDFEMHQASFTAQVPIPTVDDKYTLRVLFDGTAQSKTISLQVYGSPTFTSFKFPKAGIRKQDNTLTATVKGKNFTAPNVTSDSFTVTCSENSSITNDSTVKVLSDSKLAVTLTIPSKPGEYKVAVFAGFNDNGAASTATFTGDTDGSNNWNIIYSLDPEGSANAATNYPAFNWTNTYGETYKDYLGEVTDGWYIPSVAELCYVYRNLSSINETLNVIYNINRKYVFSSEVYKGSHCSSSQNLEYPNTSWCVDMRSGKVTRGNRDFFVLVIRAF